MVYTLVAPHTQYSHNVWIKQWTKWENRYFRDIEPLVTTCITIVIVILPFFISSYDSSTHYHLYTTCFFDSFNPNGGETRYILNKSKCIALKRKKNVILTAINWWIYVKHSKWNGIHYLVIYQFECDEELSKNGINK